MLNLLSIIENNITVYSRDVIIAAEASLDLDMDWAIYWDDKICANYHIYGYRSEFISILFLYEEML